MHDNLPDLLKNKTISLKDTTTITTRNRQVYSLYFQKLQQFLKKKKLKWLRNLNYIECSEGIISTGKWRILLPCVCTKSTFFRTFHFIFLRQTAFKCKISNTEKSTLYKKVSDTSVYLSIKSNSPLQKILDGPYQMDTVFFLKTFKVFQWIQKH